jgi:hypothetical protein
MKRRSVLRLGLIGEVVRQGHFRRLHTDAYQVPMKTFLNVAAEEFLQ